MTAVDFDISGDISTNVMARDSVLNIFFQGVETPWTAGQGYTSFTWDGTNDAGQRAASGPYFIQIEQRDTYDHVITLTKVVTVIRNEQYVELKIFNSAGEIVRQIRDYEKVSTGAVVLRLPDMIFIDKDNDTSVVINYGLDPLDFMEWDSKNSAGAAVTSGVYEIMVTVKTDAGRFVTAVKSVLVLKQGDTYLGNLSAVPNPYNGSGEGIEIRWDFEDCVPKAGYANVLIVNMAGEHVRTIVKRLETGKAMWDLKNSRGELCTSGVYIAVIEAKGDDGHTQKKKIKLAISKH